MTIRGIDHIGVTVPSIDQATDFFVRALGAQVLYDTLPRQQGPKGGEATDRRLGVPEGTEEVAIRMLKLPNGPGLELFEFSGPRQRDAAIPSDIGWQHVAVYTDDLPAAVEAVEAAGGELLAEPKPLPSVEPANTTSSCTRAPRGAAPWSCSATPTSSPTPNRPTCAAGAPDARNPRSTSHRQHHPPRGEQMGQPQTTSTAPMTNDGNDPEQPPRLPILSMWTEAAGEFEGLSRIAASELAGFGMKSVGGGAAPQWIRPFPGEVKAVQFAVLPVGWVGDWHESPAPQWVVPLRGRWYIETQDGTRVEMGPGDIHFGQDQGTTEKGGNTGHKSGQLGDEPCFQLMIQFAQPPAASTRHPFGEPAAARS